MQAPTIISLEKSLEISPQIVESFGHLLMSQNSVKTSFQRIDLKSELEINWISVL